MVSSSSNTRARVVAAVSDARSETCARSCRGSSRVRWGRVKIDGNADDAPHVTECPWAEDRECDAQQYLELQPYELDLRDCCFEGCGAP
jgi:hypothetical protein